MASFLKLTNGVPKTFEESETLPVQTISGQVLQTNGSAASWFSLVPSNSMVWTDSAGLASTTAVDGILLSAFDNISNNAIYSTVTIPSLYPTGGAIKLKYGQFFNESVTGKVFFKAVTKLIKSGTVLGTYTDTFTSTNAEVTVNATSNTITNTGDINLCSTVGTINDVSIIPGMKLLIKLMRDNASESSSAAADALLLVNSFEIGFEPPSNATLTGGTITTSGLYTYHTFLSSDSLVVSGGFKSIDYLMVAAGGSGGGYDGSGGGGGGFIETFSSNILSGTYPIVIGAGALSSNGGNTTFNSITAIGGGHGGIGGGSNVIFPPTTGGSGGGGACNSGGTYITGAIGTVGQGYAGGNALAPGGSYPSAGGGGAGGIGQSIFTDNDDGGAGGVGAISTITGNYYAGGGGGGAGDGGGSIPGIGGTGGGGAGGLIDMGGNDIYPATAGIANTGGGGGGGGNTDADFHSGYAAGGSGIVVIRYLT
jgi:hypothetical protein